MVGFGALLQLAAPKPAYNPLRLAIGIGGRPDIFFRWEMDSNGKRRLIGHPNKPMRALHEAFGGYITGALATAGANHSIWTLPSASAFVRGTNHVRNALRHMRGRFFYVTDLEKAYPSVDLNRLALLLTYAKQWKEYEFDFSLARLRTSEELAEELRSDALYCQMRQFLLLYCSGVHGKGLAVGAPLSPRLFNLYAEAFLDDPLRKLCFAHQITYSRYADDLVFSRMIVIPSDVRAAIRDYITDAGFTVNHRKSKVLCRSMGTIPVTKTGLTRADDWKDMRLAFPQRKRKRLHGLIYSYLRGRGDNPYVVRGYIGEFLQYARLAGTPTATDQKTMLLCKEFETALKKS